MVNDTYGQNIGDELLQSFSETLKRCICGGDTLTRLGSDEFILLLPNINTEKDAIAVVNKIVAETSLPFEHDGHEIHITLSIGIAIYPDHGKTREDLIKNADTAVCNAKTKTKNSYYLYNKKLKNKNSTIVFIEDLIRDAIKNDRFIIHYQPQIDLATNKIHAAEALVRIMSPSKKLIPPGKFIDIAEETSLINDIGDIVLEKVCHDIKSWNTQGLKIRIAVNISAVQLAIKYFAESVLEKIHGYGLDPKEFELELTENVLIQNMKRTISNIVKLTDAGIRIAIDDFGTGYSSLGYLGRLPLNTLKLDRSFMQNVSAKNMNNTIIPAIINVSNGLQLDFIAEGVETQAQHEYLLQQGSCIAQGFYYSRPLEKEQLIAFIDKHGIKEQS